MESGRGKSPEGPLLLLAAVSGFGRWAGLSRLSLANHFVCAHIWSDAGSHLVASTPLSQDGFQPKGFWEVGRTHGLASPPSF